MTVTLPAEVTASTATFGPKTSGSNPHAEVRSSILLSSTIRHKGFVKVREHVKRMYARRYALTAAKTGISRSQNRQIRNR